MDAKFLAHVKALKAQAKELLAMKPVTPLSLPTVVPRAGVYRCRKQTATFTSDEAMTFVNASDAIQNVD